MRRNRRAKIVATLGPASSDKKTIRALFEAGADVFRLNFSHGSHDDHAGRYRLIRELEAETGRPIGVLQDLQGPKIRIGKVTKEQRKVAAGAVVRFSCAKSPKNAVPLPHPEVIASLSPGDHLLVDDGRLKFRIVKVGKDWADAEAVYDGALSDHKGVNLPDTIVRLSPLTDKDRADLAFGLELGVDWVALSFVQQPTDILEAREIIGDRAGILAKIEKPAALDAIDDIISLCDAIMVARGDLGVEIPPEDVPGRQKELVRACRLAGKPVVVATHMLDSMTESPTPTRAEASDIATAIYDGADAVMLSGETAAGKYPAEATAFMDRTIARTEVHKSYRSIITALQPAVEQTVQHAVSAAAAEVAEAVGAAAIVAFTSSGATASRIARMRPPVPIIATSPDRRVVRRLVLLWGSHSLQSEEIANFTEMVEHARAFAVQESFARARDKVVIVAGVPFGTAGSTNNLRVIEV